MLATELALFLCQHAVEHAVPLARGFLNVQGRFICACRCGCSHLVLYMCLYLADGSGAVLAQPDGLDRTHAAHVIQNIDVKESSSANPLSQQPCPYMPSSAPQVHMTLSNKVLGSYTQLCLQA